MLFRMDMKDNNQLLYGGAFYDVEALTKDKPVYIKSVVYNSKKKTTAVVWSDFTTTTAKCSEEDTYNEDLGLTIAVMRKVCGKEFVRKLFRDWAVDLSKSESGVEIRTLKEVRKEYKENN